MLNYDDLLQQELARLENGQPLEELLAGLPPESAGLAPLIRLAAAVRSLPHPEPGPEALSLQRQRVLAAAQAHTRPLPRPARRPWAGRKTWQWLGGAAVLAAIGTFVLLFAVLAGGLGGWPGLQGHDTARVETVVGQVQVAAGPHSSDWKDLRAGDRVRQGQRLRSLGESYATLVFSEGSHTFVSANADLTFARLGAASRGDLQVEMVQNGGETWHKVTPLRDEQSFFQVRTPSGMASVHGTSFGVKVGQDGLAHFAVDTGEVRVANAGQEVTLLAGQATAAHPGGEIEPPTYQFALKGSLLSIDETTGIWNVSGASFLVSGATDIAGAPELGDVVAVSGRILADGTRVADSIRPAGTDEQTALFTGPLEYRGTGEEPWRIGGIPVKVTAETVLDEALEVGMAVRVTFNVLADQTWLALQIEGLVEDPGDETPTPLATDGPGATPSSEYEPDELESTPALTQTPAPTVPPTETDTPGLTLTATVPPTPALESQGAGQCTGADPHPTGMKLAQRYGAPYEDIMHWFCDFHYGFGEIDLAYSLRHQTGRPVEEIFAMRASGMGWGNIKKALLEEQQDGVEEGEKKDKKEKKDK
jgi:hypothetical protein